MKNTQFKYLLYVAALFTVSTPNNAHAEKNQIMIDKSAIVMTQINIAKKNVLGHLIGSKSPQEIELNGARVMAPEYAENNKVQPKIWFTTTEGKQLKWPFIDLYNPVENVENIEPAAGTPELEKPYKLYNHYSGITHDAFKNALPSTFREKGMEPYYAAVNLPSGDRPQPRKLSFID